MGEATDVTVLLVDDYAPSRYGFRRILAPDGYTFAEAADGAAALRELGPSVQVAIVDINLPDMNGFDLCVKLKERQPGIQIVLISASYQVIEQHGEWPACGAAAFIEQPVEADELRALVRKLLAAPPEA